jgi:DNA invertase Pin-like site-specific DNA recombinase
VPAAVYCRISEDRTGGALGVTRQEADCRQLAARLGWSIGQVFVDNDLSASSGKPRPAYRQMLAHLLDGYLDTVLAWHPDRLHRSPAELEEFIAICDRHRVKVATVQAGHFDLSTPSGRAVARTIGAWARFESEHKSERLRRKAQELAATGKYAGGGTRTYGYDDRRRGVREKEAEVIRGLAARFLAGESLRSLCRWLNETGIPTVTGVPWTMQTLRRILGAACISGQREHHGVITAVGDWEPIITPQETARIRAILADPQRRTNRAARRYLLAGMVTCGRCEGPMVARPRDDGRRRYVCPGPTGRPSSCGRMFILADDLERFVVEAALIALDGPALAAAIVRRAATQPDATRLTNELTEAETALQDLASMFGRGEITKAQLVAGNRAAHDRLARLQAQLAALTDTSALAGAVGHAAVLRERWATLNLDRQRATVRAVVDKVTVLPGIRGLNRFDDRRVRIEWRY